MENEHLNRYRQRHLRGAQLKMLYILEEVVGICDRHNIPYWLDGGTLLGAARHGGFIPWDDDIDISMRKDDLERFIKIAPQELPANLKLQTQETDPELPQKEYKVRDLDSFFVDGDDNNKAHYLKGIFIDIFPFVDYPARFQKLTKKITRSMAVMNFKLHAPHYYSWRSVAEGVYFGLKLTAYKMLWALLKTTANGEYTCALPEYNWYGAIYRQKDLFPLGTIEFEGKTFSAPNNPDDYLKCIYRNWRELPPKEKRVVHSMFFLESLSECSTPNSELPKTNE